MSWERSFSKSHSQGTFSNDKSCQGIDSGLIGNTFLLKDSSFKWL